MENAGPILAPPGVSRVDRLRTAIADAPNSDTDDLKVSCVPNGLMLCFPVASLMADSRADSFDSVLGKPAATN